jgi:DNA-damage-inducible protein D
MTGEELKNTKSIFEGIKRIDKDGNEFWSARDLAKVLEYKDYRNFKATLNKAKTACETSGYEVSNHIVDTTDMIPGGKGAKRKYESAELSRYACYLVVQNADPSKEVVALGQTYFAVQTRIQEIQQMDEYNQLNTEEEKRLFLRTELKEHNKNLQKSAKVAGATSSLDYAIFQNHGYKGLYGGLDNKGIHKKKGLKKSQEILDHMGLTELAANLFRATQTDEKLKESINNEE